ncbi:MAG: type II secretion system protein N [Enterobacterales bacterium]|nr:type II secretion system protein N [Enterobacterales bacterium]
MTAPVNLLTSIIEKQNRVQVMGLKGTLWRGQIEQLNYSSWQLNQVNYSLAFFPLLIGKVSTHLSIKKGDLRGPLDLILVSQTELQIEHAKLEMSASQLQRFIPFPGVSLKGELSTDDFSLTLDKARLIAISGLTHWMNSEVSIGSNQFTLGNYSAEWKTDSSGKMTGRIITSTNALSLQGNISLSPQGVFEFKGSVAKDIDQRLYNSLLFFSSGPVKDGRLPLLFKKKIF